MFKVGWKGPLGPSSMQLGCDRCHIRVLTPSRFETSSHHVSLNLFQGPLRAIFCGRLLYESLLGCLLSCACLWHQERRRSIPSFLRTPLPTHHRTLPTRRFRFLTPSGFQHIAVPSYRCVSSYYRIYRILFKSSGTPQTHSTTRKHPTDLKIKNIYKVPEVLKVTVHIDFGRIFRSNTGSHFRKPENFQKPNIRLLYIIYYFFFYLFPEVGSQKRIMVNEKSVDILYGLNGPSQLPDYQKRYQDAKCSSFLITATAGNWVHKYKCIDINM